MGKGIPVKLEINGSEVLKNEWKEDIPTKNLEHFVIIIGNRKLEDLKEVYKAAHFFMLASQSEGWPKAVAEAMFFGCIPIVTSVSCVPWMLSPPPDNYRGRKGEIAPSAPNGGTKKIIITKRGILAPPAPKGEAKINEWVKGIIEKILELIKDQEKMKRMSLAGQEWSQEYTLERFEEGIKKILHDSHKEEINGEKR